MAMFRYVAGLFMLPMQVLGATGTGWIGTYTSHGDANTGSTGIYSFQWDGSTGSLGTIREAAAATNPSFLALHPNGRFLYAVNEIAPPTEGGRVTAFAVGDSASSQPLTALGSVSSMGKGPCHLSIDSTGKWLFVANYGSGSIAVYPILSDGRLGEAKQTIQQRDSDPGAGDSKKPHAHEVVQSPDGHFLLSADLGLDKLFVYRFDAASGMLTANDPAAATFPSGYGPRHLIFSKDAKVVYVLTELTASLITFRWDARRGSLTPLAETSTMPQDFTGRRSAAEIALHPDGKFLYTSNRGDSNTISIFKIAHHGLPMRIGSVSSGGMTPRFIGVDASGRFLIAANQDSNDVTTFRINPVSGALTRLRGDVAVPAPVDVVFAHPRTKNSAR